MVSTHAGVALYRSKGFEIMSSLEVLHHDNVWDVTIDRKGRIRGGTQEGLACFDGKVWRKWTTKNRPAVKTWTEASGLEREPACHT